jgi:Phosphotransferase enzyme family
MTTEAAGPVAGFVAGSVAELLAGATSRGGMDKTVDSLSGSSFERAVIGGVRHVVKYVGHDTDWLARALGDRDCFVLTLWREGLLDALPPSIDHTIVGVARDGDTGRVALLMRDVARWLVPPGSAPLTPDEHVRFLDHMAEMHASFWGFEDRFGLLPPGNRYTALTPATGEREAAAGHDDPVPRALAGGWAALARAAPEAYRYSRALADDPSPLVDALADTPATFIHGDWKAGNLGAHLDGRTILLDWGWPGRAAPLVDVAWYLAVNCDRLPTTKEQTVADYRRCLERHGVHTGDWWDRQLALALLGGFVQLGWSKTGDADELGWWLERVLPVARDLLP